MDAPEPLTPSPNYKVTEELIINLIFQKIYNNIYNNKKIE